jgi:hypothetical protein
MVFAPPLNTDDLRRWRSCERRFWLARRQLQRGVAASGPTPAEPEPGTGLDMALRASFPYADGGRAAKPRAVAAGRATPSTASTATPSRRGLGHPRRLPHQRRQRQVRIDVLTAGEHGLRLSQLRYATVGDDSDVDDVAL